jgi:hypothetical protein
MEQQAIQASAKVARYPKAQRFATPTKRMKWQRAALKALQLVRFTEFPSKN